MIDAHEFDNDDARKTLVFNSLKLGKVEKSRETDRVAGQRPCARQGSRTIAGQRPCHRGIAVQIMSWLVSLARVRHSRFLQSTLTPPFFSTSLQQDLLNIASSKTLLPAFP